MLLEFELQTEVHVSWPALSNDWVARGHIGGFYKRRECVLAWVATTCNGNRAITQYIVVGEVMEVPVIEQVVRLPSKLYAELFGDFCGLAERKIPLA